MAEEDPRIVALTAAMPGPTGLLPFQARFPDRFFDVGIAEQHEVTAAAGMAMAGLRPVVAVYSTFLSRAFDQANLDVGLHGCPVVFVLDRAGITGDDGASHHGILDLSLALSIPGHDGVRSVVGGGGRADAADRSVVVGSVDDPLPQDGAAPRGAGRGRRGAGGAAIASAATGRCAYSGWARWSARALRRRTSWPHEGVEATVWDCAGDRPPDVAMLADAARHQLVVTAEDGVRHGGAGAFLVDAMAAQVESDGLPMPATGCWASPGSSWRRARRTTSWPAWDWTAPGIAESVRRVQARGAGGGAAALTATRGLGHGTAGRRSDQLGSGGPRCGDGLVAGTGPAGPQLDPLPELQHRSAVDPGGEPAP